MRNKLLSIVLWSMIAAAFIGPGTLTTASAAGAGFGYDLVWALVFATVACMVLQEASARISIINHSELPQIFRKVYSTRAGISLLYLMAGAVIFGCAAYQAGNILGAISGIGLISDWPQGILIAGIGGIAAFLLFLGSYRLLATVLSAMVGLMGISFLLIVLVSEQDIWGFFKGLIPSIPNNSEWLVLGLVGTTIVPYNLFLGSGISKGQSISLMRMGLVVSIGLGGIISIAILMTGSLIHGEFSFQALANAMETSLGSWSSYLLAAGLFAAGFTSSITAPLAAGIIARGLFKGREAGYHAGWALVLGAGLIIGSLGLRPVPVIIAAQALNGFILPLISMFLLVMVNDRRIVGELRNTLLQNAIFTAVLIVSVAIGVNNLLNAVSNFSELNGNKYWLLPGLTMVIVIISLFVVYKIRKVSPQ